jgi:NADPH-dependent 2,4-dienoyl-CoA reductase/sulfur reductase-like enzyme/nitrite reductase/ring-hydroxylating ferredoxin subunit
MFAPVISSGSFLEEEMSGHAPEVEGPDLGLGVKLSEIGDSGMLTGHVGEEAVLLVHRDGNTYAVGATCPHYGAPLGDGLIVGETLRCPWHHACFDLHTGALLRAPALDPLPCWRVEVRDGVAFVHEKREPAARERVDSGTAPESVVIVGGGAAGNAAAEMLRNLGYAGAITMISGDSALPCDRPNLSKDYLAGKAPEEWTLLRQPDFYAEHRIDVRLDTAVLAIDTAAREVELAGGDRLPYGALLLATGATPVKLDVPGADLPHVHYLRTLADSRALVAAASTARNVVIIGSSFIGLEVASSLRARDIHVEVVGREAVPMERVLGPELGKYIQSVHEQHGVLFHVGRSPTAIDAAGVTLDDGARIDADLVVVGIGVRPSVELAEQAGLTIDHGVLVDEFLETSAPGIYAAGDIARWPDRLSGEAIRVEHFVVAERQGQTAARNMLGHRQPFDAVPFFWTEQYDLGIAYVGHAEKWDEIAIDGSIAERNCSLTFVRDGRKQAVAVIHRDLEGLRAEVELERSPAPPQEARVG